MKGERTSCQQHHHQIERASTSTPHPNYKMIITFAVATIMASKQALDPPIVSASGVAKAILLALEFHDLTSVFTGVNGRHRTKAAGA